LSRTIVLPTSLTLIVELVRLFSLPMLTLTGAVVVARLAESVTRALVDSLIAWSTAAKCAAPNASRQRSTSASAS